jgi:anti-anti-sigma factor
LLIDAEAVVRGITKVNLRGRLDVAGVEAIEAAFARFAGARQRLIVDLSRVSFIASAGLRTLAMAARRTADDEGRMVFLLPDPSVEAVLITTGLDRLVPICRTIADAVQAVSLGDDEEDDFQQQPLSFSLQVDRTPTGLKRVGAWVDEIAILVNLSMRCEYALRLCLEEAITAIIAKADPPPAPHDDRLALRLIADPNRLSLTIQDQCASFNPLAEPPGSPQDDVPGEGDFSLSLLRQHARDLAWSRVGQTNRLAMTIPR